MKWNASYGEDIYPYTNNIYQKDGGTHLLGFRSALTRVINKYATEHNLLKKNKLTISGDDIKEGLTCVISAKIPDPKFSSQTKDKLVSSEVRMIVESIVSEKLSIWFDQNPTLSKIILAKVMQAALARDVARKARENVRRKGALELSGLPGKLADCQIGKQEGTELFIVKEILLVVLLNKEEIGQIRRFYHLEVKFLILMWKRLFLKRIVIKMVANIEQNP